MTDRLRLLGSILAAAIGSTLLAGCASVERAADAGLAPFSTDGCSRFPDRSATGRTDWCHCCVAHDLAYWRGGTADERLHADQGLRACVRQSGGGGLLAALMYAGVRVGGSPHRPTPYRWAYGWPYGRGYQALSPGERLRADQLEQAYRATNPTLACPEAAPAPAPDDDLLLP
jgi:hypothetical protein